MKKLLTVISITTFLMFFMAQAVHAANFDAINTPIIRTQPPNDAVIISQGQGDIHTPSGFSNYYNADWALAQTNNSQILYVWNIENSGPDVLPFIIVLGGVPLIISVFLMLVRDD